MIREDHKGQLLFFCTLLFSQQEFACFLRDRHTL